MVPPVTQHPSLNRGWQEGSRAGSTRQKVWWWHRGDSKGWSRDPEGPKPPDFTPVGTLTTFKRGRWWWLPSPWEKARDLKQIFLRVLLEVFYQGEESPEEKSQLPAPQGSFYKLVPQRDAGCCGSTLGPKSVGTQPPPAGYFTGHLTFPKERRCYRHCC